ncbi:cupin domain-containing protein [Pseudoleptotrichia goodfellowii]|uniref:Cupin n=1 Tax=Pseudoleptotrichia goodfellowii TaxID=157692 RepID=A0A510J9B0_9FUSO|nr:cupin domain-containing protein [Pseudoleptotrichia goodfellowii]BBM35744.1 cupin [Pseudoleptotrichia goodfellowii]
MYGTVKNEAGMLFSGNNFKVVKKILKTGELIPSHNHEEEEIVFSVLKGKMEMFLNDTEKHVLVPGDILNFDGVNFIQGTALEDSEINVTLVKK